MLKQRNEETRSEDPHPTFRATQSNARSSQQSLDREDEVRKNGVLVIKPKFVKFNNDFIHSGEVITESKDLVGTPLNILDSSPGLAGINLVNSRNNPHDCSYEQCKVDDSINTITVD
jgi:hypothetical protein